MKCTQCSKDGAGRGCARPDVWRGDPGNRGLPGGEVEPEDTFVGTLNEDFAIESNAGDVFQLGNTSWQITQVVAGSVRVRDAHGAPPTIPFWLGEAPARSDELSRAVSNLRADVETVCRGADLSLSAEASAKAEGPPGEPEGLAPPVNLERWLQAETGLCPGGAEQAASYLLDGRAALGVIPTQETLVLERFFGNRAACSSSCTRRWQPHQQGVDTALRKQFPGSSASARPPHDRRRAAASLGPRHSFPLSDSSGISIRRRATSCRRCNAPLFKTLALERDDLAYVRAAAAVKCRPASAQQADDLMAAVFPDAAACLREHSGRS
jgi:ATP-dependent Lhr-like helicase